MSMCCCCRPHRKKKTYVNESGELIIAESRKKGPSSQNKAIENKSANSSEAGSRSSKKSLKQSSSSSSKKKKEFIVEEHVPFPRAEGASSKKSSKKRKKVEVESPRPSFEEKPVVSPLNRRSVDRDHEVLHIVSPPTRPPQRLETPRMLSPPSSPPPKKSFFSKLISMFKKEPKREELGSPHTGSGIATGTATTDSFFLHGSDYQHERRPTPQATGASKPSEQPTGSNSENNLDSMFVAGSVDKSTVQETMLFDATSNDKQTPTAYPTPLKAKKK